MEKQRKIRTRRVLSLKERIDVIQTAKTVKGIKELARHFDCGRTQIMSILQQADRLQKEWHNNGDPNRLRRRPSSYASAINKVVAEWVRRARAAQISLSDSMIIERAYQAKKFFKYSEFRPNNRWLERFKRRFRLDEIDLTTPNPKLKGSKLQSLKLSHIFHDIKDTLESSIVEVMLERQTHEEYKQFLLAESDGDDDICGSLTNRSPLQENVVKSEVEDFDDSDYTCQAESSCDADIADRGDSPIRSDEQALECVKMLEEYSMLKDNYRAIGLITQLEKLFKGQIEA